MPSQAQNVIRRKLNNSISILSLESRKNPAEFDPDLLVNLSRIYVRMAIRSIQTGTECIGVSGAVADDFTSGSGSGSALSLRVAAKSISLVTASTEPHSYFYSTFILSLVDNKNIFTMLTQESPQKYPAKESRKMADAPLHPLNPRH